MPTNDTNLGIDTSGRGRFSKIPVDTFENLQMRAGMVLTAFDTTNWTYNMEDILCATSGGLNITFNDETRDNGEGIDNCPKNMMELMEIKDRNATIQITSVTFSDNFLKFALSAADYDDSTKRIKPRFKLQTTDFKDIWVVGDKLDGTGIAFHLMRGLSANGLTWQTTDDGKGTLALTITGHYSLAAQSTAPYEMYLIPEDTSTTWNVTNTLTHVTNSNTAATVTRGAAYEGTLTADTDYTISTVQVKMDGIDITATVYNTTTGEITIPEASGNIVITATATAD